MRSDLQGADRQRQLVLDAVRSTEMRAYGLEGTNLLAGLLDFPVPEQGPSFVWIGYWDSASARRSRTTPLVLTATGPARARAALHDRLRVRPDGQKSSLAHSIRFDTLSGSQERHLVPATNGTSFADVEDGDTAVTVVASNVKALPLTLTLVKWTDREALIQEWISLFG